jgi:hypothetical protein
LLLLLVLVRALLRAWSFFFCFHFIALIAHKLLIQGAMRESAVQKLTVRDNEIIYQYPRPLSGEKLFTAHPGA